MSNLKTNEASIEGFENAWDGGSLEIAAFLPEESSAEYLGTLIELVIIDLEFRWKRFTEGSNDPAVFSTVEDYIKCFPALDTDLHKRQLLEEEFTIRRKYGDDPPVSSFIERFPHLAEEIRHLDLEFPQGKNTTCRRSTTSRESLLIDQYTLVGEIGEGGMGSVYLAQQDKPVRRKVAIKVIRRGLDTKDVIARFEAERQALAMMDHQNIARIYDAGVTNQGQPFFAMEFVDGVPITDYCRQNRLGIPDRLRIFNDVCAAVQHAHQKGILHRDLKPSNVLIAQSADQPIAKVIDFGLAKAIDSDQLLTDKSLYTQAGQVLGTLKYMSPEQAATSEKDVDTRADVYALGVMLYELLTGETPLDESAIKSQGVLSVLEMIRDLEPQRPSTKLDSVAETKGRVSEERGTNSSALRQVLRGDLDWVVMKALEKDRERRYESANSLADDVRRFLNDEPVLARPPSVSYRLKKFSKKNRLLVTSGLAMLLLLMAGLAATAWQAIRATNAEKDATSQKEIAVAKAAESERRRIEANDLRAKEADARKEAESAAERAERILKFVVDSYHAADPLKGGKKEMLARDVLVQALDNVSKQVDGDPLSQAALYDALASSLYGLGDYDSAKKASQLAYSFYVDTLGYQHEKTIRANLLYAYILLGKDDGYRAREFFNASLEVQSGALFGNNPISLEDLLASSPLAIETLIGAAKALLAPPYPQPESAVNQAKQALDAAGKLLGKEHEITVEAKLTLATGFQRIGNTEMAIQLYREILAIRNTTHGKGHPDTIAVTLQLGAALESHDVVDQAIDLLEMAVDLSEQALGNKHPRTLEAEFQLAEMLIRDKQLNKARELFDSIRSRLDSSYLAFHRSLRGLARTYLMNHETQAALELFPGEFFEIAWIYQVTAQPDLAADAYENLLEQEKDQSEQSRILQRILALRLWDGELKLADSALKRWLELPKEIKPINSESEEDISVRKLRVRHWVAQGDFAKAETETIELLNLTSMVYPSFNETGLGVPGEIPKLSHAVTGPSRAWCKSILALCHAERGSRDHDAENMAIDAFEELHSSMPSIPSYRRWLVGRSCERIIRICKLTQRPEEADKWARRLPEIEKERVELTLEDSWREYLLKQRNASGLSSVK